MTLLPLDFEHFSPNIDNFAPIQKETLCQIFFWGGRVGTLIVLAESVMKLEDHIFFRTFFLNFIF